MGSVWKMAKRMSGNDAGFKISCLKVGNSKFLNNKDKANILADAFANVSSDTNYSEEFRRRKRAHTLSNFGNKNMDNTQKYNTEFTVQELKTALNNCSTSKSPGHDNIPYEFLKESPVELVEIILRLYNLIWKRGRVPIIWKHAIVLPLHKPNKPQADPLSYRPIPLTSTMCKIMERLVVDRLNWYME